MNSQIEHAKQLKKLHIKGDPLILFNIWDAGSAKAIEESGGKVIATSSWAIAASQGYEDGQKLPLDFALNIIKRVIDRVNIPVTVDIEGGYGITPKEVQQTVRRVIEAGAVGINFEDQIIGENSLYSINEQCDRIKAVQEITQSLCIPIFINARTDIFLKTPSKHNKHHLEESVERAIAYAASGADGFFAPGLNDPILIKELCELSPIPVNIMRLSEMVSNNQLAELGVARISYGPAPFSQMIEMLKLAHRQASRL
ncbi:MAG: isocitrate lyase/phosphoenolpyruvate mutase family protein [Gammaproteobacteria bacterium]|jgi:2-methylisocitrate lyase-like PEP mutase family enzyme|nr:isocitrate lyase/phosphoenolpyruvate mutase family protein [Gammaproteobacteria bacterium]